MILWKPLHIAALSAVLAFCAAPAVSATPQIHKQPDGVLVAESHGIILAAVPPEPETDYGLPLMPVEEGLRKLAKALDGLVATGAEARAALDRLRAAGSVEIVYTPAFPPSEGSSLTLGAFLPEYFEPDEGKRRLYTVISRFGIKWAHDELVAILAHELLGHGIQHLNGWLDRVRRIDLECGAELYREAVYQGLNVNKRESRIVNFRKTLERHWCRPFKAYQRKFAPDSLALWQRLNPDVPGLLAVLEGFYAHQIESGMGARAVALDRDVMLRRAIAEIRREEGENAARILFDEAVTYRDGIDVRRDKRKARLLFEAAAESGHPTAASEAEKLSR